MQILNRLTAEVMYDIDTFVGGDFSGWDFSHADLGNRNMHNGTFIDANFTGATLYAACGQGAKFQGANFTQADMRCMSLYGANLDSVVLDRAYLHKADLTMVSGIRIFGPMPPRGRIIHYVEATRMIHFDGEFWGSKEQLLEAAADCDKVECQLLFKLLEVVEQQNNR